MKTPVTVAPQPMRVRLMWMAIIWAAGVACVLVVSLALRGILHH